MATNLEVGEYKNIGEKTCVAPSLNFMFVPSNQNKHAVAKCCVQLGRVGKCREVGDGGMGGWGDGGGRCRKCFLLFCGFLS